MRPAAKEIGLLSIQTASLCIPYSLCNNHFKFFGILLFISPHAAALSKNKKSVYAEAAQTMYCVKKQLPGDGRNPWA